VGLKHSRPVDVVALASVISSATVGLTVPFYTAHRTAKTARDGRVEQRSVDGYLKILSLAEQEAQWLDSLVLNLGVGRKELEYGVVSFLQVPKPAVTDRATEAAVIAALASKPVQTSHAAWRTAADDLRQEDVGPGGTPRRPNRPSVLGLKFVA
jgi:hypothetical protein